MQVSLKETNKATNNSAPVEEGTRSIDEAYGKLKDYLDDLKSNKNNLSAHEHEEAILRLTRSIGQASIGELLAHYDVDDDVISLGNQTYRRKHKARKFYQTSIGPVEVVRHVYANRKLDGNGKSICPVELQAGIVEGYWTAKGAQNAAWLLAHLTPQETEEALLQLGMMTPSRSSLDRLPKALMPTWDEQILEHQNMITEQEEIPEAAVCMAASLDGVMVGMKPKQDERNQGKQRQCEWKEASCGTVSFFDKEGNRLKTTLYGRMPEHKKQCLKSMLRNHVEIVLKAKPDMKLVHIADGAQDNWTFFDEDMPLGFQLTDYFHACQYLKKAFDAAYPKDKTKAKEKYQYYKAVLRDKTDGITTVLRSLRYQKQKNKTNEDIKTAVTYFTNNQHRMRYAEAKKNNYPIGSGIVEAACKSLVSQRMKRSGMSWDYLGGQSILTLRALVKSNRFDMAWDGIIKRYKTTITKHDNVVNLFG